MSNFKGRVSGKVFKVLLSLLVTACFSTTVSAAQEEEEEKDVYLGADLSFAAISVGNQSLNTLNARFKVGLDMFPDLIPLLTLESHFSLDLTEDTATINGTDATLHINNYIGLYVKASHEIEDVVAFYGLLGFSAAQMQGDTFVLKDDTATGLSFGVGAGFGLPFDLEGTVEIMQLVNSDAYDVLLFSFGINYRM